MQKKVGFFQMYLLFFKQNVSQLFNIINEPIPTNTHWSHWEKKKSIPLYFSLKIKRAPHKKGPNPARLWVPLAHLVQLGPEQQHVV